ncbi:hypothetical protein EYF80_008981 [Liparis tanakae]|uniref:Alcohol dehydrogenase-like N-terminal domain-containing protein n=1 Tax=Liparis tanakae TaxID=230148 RepID=A0A4Z2ISJ9_9TELE|nr:hypothetical protein EYF80_008981 [Liparis tanakae]
MVEEPDIVNCSFPDITDEDRCDKVRGPPTPPHPYSITTTTTPKRGREREGREVLSGPCSEGLDLFLNTKCGRGPEKTTGMFPVQVYHRACTIETVSVVSAAALVRRAGRVRLGTISMLSMPMGVVSGVSMAGKVDAAGMGDTGFSVGGSVLMSTLGRLCMDTVEGTAGVVGTVGLADGEHSEYDTWQTLGTVFNVYFSVVNFWLSSHIWLFRLVSSQLMGSASRSDPARCSPQQHVILSLRVT